MTELDCDGAVQLENACFSMPWSKKSFLDSLQREDTLFFVCEEEEEIVGYVGMYISFDEAEITNIAVAPDCRNKGYGRKLLLAAKEELLARSVAELFLEVRVSNEPAIHLYEKMGFEQIGIRKNYYERPREDAIIMKVGL